MNFAEIGIGPGKGLGEASFVGLRRLWLSVSAAAQVVVLIAVPTASIAATPASAPPLPPPTGRIVNVSSEAQLQNAVDALTSGTTIVIAPGTYNLSSTVYINGSYTDVGIRGATNNPNDVVLVGKGMSNENYGEVPHGIWTGNGVTRVTIANLTVRGVYYHPIALNPGTESPLIYNVRLVDAGEQFIKSSSSPSGGTDDGRVEYSTFEYSTTARSDYTNAIDVHIGRGWIIRHNLFRNIRAPQGLLAGPAILMWNSSADTLVEANTFIDCHREISLGLIQRTPNDHSGGIVRNNFIYRAPGVGGDVAIGIFDSPNTVIQHNTILLMGNYASSIEYRFTDTTQLSIVNNLADAAIRARDGATATVQNNVTSATASLFVDPASGDLHLKQSATIAVDRGVSLGGAWTDFDGTARPVGSLPDVGADEFGGTTSEVPAAPTNLRIVSSN